MGNFSEIQRVVCRHDWQSVAEWASALGDLADLTDDEIDGLARSNEQRDAPSAFNAHALPDGGEPQASWSVLQAIHHMFASGIRSGASKSIALLIPYARH